MSYNDIPWPLLKEPKAIKEKRKEMQLKELSKRVEEGTPITVARIIAFLNKNKNQTYTNAQIAHEVGVKSVAGIMDKLEEIGVVKVVKIRKGVASGISQVYQSGVGTLEKVKKERMAESLMSKVLTLFNKNINKVYSKDEIAKELSTTKDRLSGVLSILVVTDNIKLVDAEGETFLYQSIKGNQKAIDISEEPNNAYITLENYIKMSNVRGNVKEFKNIVAEERDHARVFYSNRGPVKEYEITYLQKVIGLGEEKNKKKSIFEKIKVL